MYRIKENHQRRETSDKEGNRRATGRGRQGRKETETESKEIEARKQVIKKERGRRENTGKKGKRYLDDK